MTFQNIVLLGLVHGLILVPVARGQDNESPIPPLPLPNSEVAPEPAAGERPFLIPGQEEELQALTEEEREQIQLPVNLNLKKANEFQIRTEPRVYLDEEDPGRGFIEPPPMQANSFNVASESISLHLFLGNGVEHPYYTPVAPFCYPPLYFEEPFLERYGDTLCCPVQSVVSGAKFYTHIAVLPVNMVVDPPCRPLLNLWADPVDNADAWR